MNTEEAISLLGSRADFYRQIAQWYFAPLSEEQIEALAAQDLRALAEDDQSSYAEGYNDLYRALRLRHTGTRQALAADFTGAFYGVTTAEGETAQPFESLYRYDGGSLMGQPRGEVYRALKQARLKVREGLDLPDGPPLFHRGVRGRALRPGCNVSAGRGCCGGRSDAFRPTGILR